MKLFWIILSSLFILYVWIWIINSAFSSHALKFKVAFKVLGIGTLLVGGLFAYSYLLKTVGYTNFLLFKTISIKSILLFIVYCTSILVLLNLFFRKLYKKLFLFLVLGASFFVLVAYGGLIIGINFLLIYYIISAYAEEFMKYYASNTLFSTEKEFLENKRDSIFFCIVVGLGFAVLENILYIANLLLNQQGVGALGMLIGRGVVSSLLHVVATGLIGFFVVTLQYKYKFFIALITGLLVGVGVHSIYNISLHYQNTLFIVALIIFLFFTLSYLLFQTDKIYLTPGETNPSSSHPGLSDSQQSDQLPSNT